MSVLPGADVIGCSINVCGQVIPTAPKPLFDMGAMGSVTINLNHLTYDCPARAIVDQQSSEQTQDVAIVTESEESFSTKLSATFGLSGTYEGFTGAFSAYFRQDTSVTESYFYSLRGKTIQLYTVKLPPDVAQYVLPAVTEAIAEALASKRFAELFTTYGTHYIASVSAGGMATLSISTQKSSTVNEMSVGAAVEAEYEAIAKAKASVDYSTVDKAFLSASITHCQTTGGDPKYGSRIMDGNGNFDLWVDSVTPLPQAIGYRPVGAPDVPDEYLVGIWTLASTLADRDTIYDAFRKYLQAMSVPFLIAGGASGGSGTPYGDIQVGGDILYRNDWAALRLCVLDAESLTALHNQAYGTYDPVQQGNMARAMATFSTQDVIVIVVSTDSGWPNGTIDGALVQQLAKCSDASALSGGQNRREPYCMIGKPGIGGIGVLHPAGAGRAAIAGQLVRTPDNPSYQVIYAQAG